MSIESMLREEIVELHRLEASLVAVFDRLDGLAINRKVATLTHSLIENADRHLSDLERILAEEGWSRHAEEPAVVEAWRMEVEEKIFVAPREEALDALTLSLLRRALHLKLPCYESARLFAFYAERPLIARTLRLALEDEHNTLERLKSAAEPGVSLRAALGGGPFRSS